MECKICKALAEKEKLNVGDILLEAADEDIELRASARDYADLEKSYAWQDIKDTIFSWLMKARDDLEEMGAGHDRNEISFVQGGNAQLRAVLHLPQALAKQKELLNERREKSE